MIDGFPGWDEAWCRGSTWRTPEGEAVKRWSGVVNLREASKCDLKNFYGLDKETSKMANQLEINSIWKKYIVPWMAFYMLKCIPSGKMIEKELSSLLSAASIVSVKVHNQVERLNQNGTMRITRTTKKGFPTWCCSIPRREWISNSKYPEDIILELCELVYRWIS